jgi:hypothetical protein
MRLIIVVNTKKSNLKTLLDQGTMQNSKQLILRNLRRKVNILSSFGWFIIYKYFNKEVFKINLIFNIWESLRLVKRSRQSVRLHV